MRMVVPAERLLIVLSRPQTPAAPAFCRNWLSRETLAFATARHSKTLSFLHLRLHSITPRFDDSMSMEDTADTPDEHCPA